MTPSRWSTILLRVTTEGPYINERMSVLVLTIVVVAGISAVGFADRSVASFSLAPLYFLPLALSALVHPLRISLALSIPLPSAATHGLWLHGPVRLRVNRVQSRISDPRVVQFWDKDHLVAKELQQQLSKSQICCQRNGIIWDVATLYPKYAQWGSSPAFFGGTVLDVSSGNSATRLSHEW
jgi:hypothetical protein